MISTVIKPYAPEGISTDLILASSMSMKYSVTPKLRSSLLVTTQLFNCFNALKAVPLLVEIKCLWNTMNEVCLIFSQLLRILLPKFQKKELVTKK